MSLIGKLKLQTRWDDIPNADGAFRLLCNNPECSLSCANLKAGRVSVTSVHGQERHSQTLSKKDMSFLTLLFLDSLDESDLEILARLFNKISSEFEIKFEEKGSAILEKVQENF